MRLFSGPYDKEDPSNFITQKLNFLGFIRHRATFKRITGALPVSSYFYTSTMSPQRALRAHAFARKTGWYLLWSCCLLTTSGWQSQSRWLKEWLVLLWVSVWWEGLRTERGALQKEDSIFKFCCFIFQKTVYPSFNNAGTNVFDMMLTTTCIDGNTCHWNSNTNLFCSCML